MRDDRAWVLDLQTYAVQAIDPVGAYEQALRHDPAKLAADEALADGREKASRKTGSAGASAWATGSRGDGRTPRSGTCWPWGVSDPDGRGSACDQQREPLAYGENPDCAAGAVQRLAESAGLGQRG